MLMILNLHICLVYYIQNDCIFQILFSVSQLSNIFNATNKIRSICSSEWESNTFNKL